MKNRNIWLIALLAAVLMIAAACAAPAPATTEAPAADNSAATPAETTASADASGVELATEGPLAGVDPSGQTIVWWHNHTGTRDEQLSELIAQFNAENAYGITLDSQSQGGYDEIRDKMNASVAAGEAPAALLAGYQNDEAFYQLNGALTDMNTYVYDPFWGLTEEELADFFPGFLEQSVHPAFDNMRLGFPPNRSVEVLYYNQTWLEELGFDGPPTTPEEFKQMACAAAEANGDGTGGYILRDDASATASWTMAFGGSILTEDGKSYAYNTPATVDALTLLKEMNDEGCAYFFTEGYPNTEFAGRRAIFTQGSTSGMPFYQNDIDTVAAEEGRDPDVWGVAAIPYTTDEPVLNVYGGDIIMTKTTPEQELAAWTFVKWFTQPEIQAEWDRISGYFPTRAGTEQYLGDIIAEMPQYGQALALLPYGTYEPQLISYQGVRDAAQQAYNEVMQGADVQATMDALTAEANDLQQELMAEIQ